MRVCLNERPALKIARFMKGLSSSIANKMDLQPYLSFDDVCHLAIKIEKQQRGRKSLHTILTRSPSIHIEIETPPLDKGKGIASEPPKRLKEKKWFFKYHGFGNF